MTGRARDQSSNSEMGIFGCPEPVRSLMARPVPMSESALLRPGAFSAVKSHRRGRAGQAEAVSWLRLECTTRMYGNKFLAAVVLRRRREA